MSLFTFTIISLVGIIIVFSLNYIIFHFDNKSFAESESESEPPSTSEEQSSDTSADEQLNLGGGFIGIISQFIDFLRQFIESLRQLIESRPIDSLRESRCIASALTGGTSMLKKMVI